MRQTSTTSQSVKRQAKDSEEKPQFQSPPSILILDPLSVPALKQTSHKDAAPPQAPPPAPAVTASQQPLKLTGLQLCVETHTGPEFDRMILAFVKDSDGKQYDLLYDRDGELIQPGKGQTTQGVIKALSQFFSKQFRPGLYEGIPCLVNVVTKNQLLQETEGRLTPNKTADYGQAN